MVGRDVSALSRERAELDHELGSTVFFFLDRLFHYNKMCAYFFRVDYFLRTERPDLRA